MAGALMVRTCRTTPVPNDFLTDDDLRDAGIDPDILQQQCPWVVTGLTGNGGVRVWDATDIASILDRAEGA